MDKPIKQRTLNVDPDAEWLSFLSSIVEKWNGETGERKQDRSKRREQEILRAALRVFARDGISRSKIGDIASEAGMPLSSVYEYFPSKEELAYAVPAAQLGAFYAEYAEAAVERTTAYDRLHFYLWLAADFARRNPEWARTLYLEIWPSVMISETAVRHNIDDYVRIIVYLIRQGELRGEWPAGPNHYETAAVLNGSVNQVIITWLIYRKPRDLMKAIGSIVDRTMSLLDPLPAIAARSRKKKAISPHRR
jgi:AcrR family transcriptional regulator